MAYEYTTQVYKIKRIHNIRDYAYKVSLAGDISLTDLALVLNSLTDEAFFWVEGDTLHSTGDIDWTSLLPEELKGALQSVEKIKEGYLEEGKLPKYAAFALFAADFNRVLSPNFKANPLFRRLRRKTKEGWNLSLWFKFLHETGLNYKVEEEGVEYQVWRWFAVKPEKFEYLTLAFKGGIAVNRPFEVFAKRFSPETLKKHFAFRVKGSYRVGRLKEFKDDTLLLTFDGGFESEVPHERVVPIYLPTDRGWKDKDRTGLLKHLRLPNKVICKYVDLFGEAINRLLEPYMVKLEKEDPRWEEVKVSPYVVVDKPIEEHAAIEYIFEERKVYNPPEGALKVNLIDIALKGEKNKKLLRDAKADFVENLKLFLGDIGVEVSVEELLYDEKVKVLDPPSAEGVVRFLEENRETLEGANLNIVLYPEGEKLTEVINSLEGLERIRKTLKGLKYHLIPDREVKVFFKSQKRETKRRILFEVLRELFKLNGGSLYILDEPLPLGAVALKTERGYEVYNLFGELVKISETPPEDAVLIASSDGAEEINAPVKVDKWVTPYAVKREIESNRCLSAERGISFDLLKSKTLLVLHKGVPFDYKTAYGVEISEELDLSEVKQTLVNLSKVFDFSNLE